MESKELTAKVRELKELQALIDEAEAEAEAIKDELIAHMTAQGTEEMTVDVFKVRYQTVTQSRFDTTTFKAKYADLYDQYTKQTATRRFSAPLQRGVRGRGNADTDKGNQGKVY